VPKNTEYPPANSSLLQGKNKVIKQIIALLAACFLIWLSFRGADLSKVFGYAAQVNPLFLALMCLSALLSHLIRSWRWLILMRPLKANISLWHSFCAVIYGYAVNIVIPRGGEIVRLITISKTESLPWAGVLPTLLIDRLLDLVTVAILIGFTLIALPADMLQSMPWIYPSGITITIGSLTLLLLLPKLSPLLSFLLSFPNIKRLIPTAISEKINDLLAQFAAGTKCLTDPLSYPIIALSTIAIWFCYWLNFYFVLLAFSLDKTLTLSKGLMLFTVSSLGSLVPTPGCVGGFHLLVSKCLVLIFGVNQDLALAFATVLHAFAFIIVVCSAAFLCFLWQEFRFSKINKVITPIE
jgi:glycosyltransferase 2 family protein